MSDNTYGSVILHVESWYFFYFLQPKKKLSISTYGSADLRIEILNNRNGSYIKKTLYLTIFMTFGQDFMIQINVVFGGIRMFYGNLK